MTRCSNTHLQCGQQAEKIAREHLQANGLPLLKANYRCRVGELGLIMLDGSTLVIIEVRYRKSSSIVGPMQNLVLHVLCDLIDNALFGNGV